MNSQRRIELSKTKSLPGGKGLFKLIVPKLAAMMMNLISIGPRVILRSAFRLLKANIWTRLISALIIVIFDLYSYLRKRISRKQLIINLILSASLLAGGTVGWVFGTNSVLGIVAENTIIWIVAGIVGAGIASAVFDAICRKILGQFLKNDVEDMLDFINDEFELLVQEKSLTDDQANELAKTISISDKICINCFAKADKKKYVREVLVPCFCGVEDKIA